MSQPSDSSSVPPQPVFDNALAAAIGAEKKRRHLGGFWLWLSLTVIILGGAGVWWWLRGQSAENGSPYVTQPLERGDISLSVVATGNLEPTNEVTIGSELSGTVKEVRAEANDHVTAGQELLRLDTSRLLQQIENSRAAVASAMARVLQVQATLDEAEATLARQEELSRLSGGKLPSRAEMATTVAAVARARADLAVAEAGVASAEAQLRINENDLSKAVIRSPIDGIVLTRSIEPGQTVAASFTAPELFVIAEKLEHMKLKVAIAEADIARLKDGQRASFTVDAWPGRGYDARVTRVSYGSKITDNVITYETELEVSNDDLSLRPGMTATAQIYVGGAENVFLVPVAALRFEPEGLSSVPNASMLPTTQGASTLVDRLVPQRRRSAPASRLRQRNRDSSAITTGRIWVLEENAEGGGEPRPIDVRIGIGDGRNTEVFADELREGMAVILRRNINSVQSASR